MLYSQCNRFPWALKAHAYTLIRVFKEVQNECLLVTGFITYLNIYL